MEIIEGPGAGREISFDHPIVIGRASDADVLLEDGEVSRHHARVMPEADGSATVEDLGSANGTFINENELVGPSHFGPGDDLQIGVTVIRLRSEEEVRSGMSGVIQVPAALAMAPRAPTYVNPEVVRVDEHPSGEQEESGIPKLERYLDTRVRRRAQLAPVALFILVMLVLIVYFAVK